MIKKTSLVIILILMLTLVVTAGCASKEGQSSGKTEPQDSGEKIVLKLASGAMEKQSIGQGLIKFAELVKEKSNGKVEIELFLNGSLYSERPAIEALVNGSIDIADGADPTWASFTDALNFMGLPYVFESQESLRKVINGPIGDQVKQKLGEQGFEPLMILDNAGYRALFTKDKPVKVPDDLKGLKLRATPSKVAIELKKAWGANPTPVDWAEVYTALAQGVVDGEHTQWTWADYGKHFEVIKYATNVNAVISVRVVSMMKTKFDSLPEDVQQVIKDAAAEAEQYEIQLDKDLLDDSIEAAKKAGVQIYQPTEEEMELWKASGKQIWGNFEKEVSADYLQQIIDAQK